MRNAQLICEGRCNPDRELLDQWIANEVIEGAPKSRPFSGELLGKLRAQKHTPHARVEGTVETFACADCGAQRVY